MRKQYCWRCRDEVPMLSEREYGPVMKVYGECLRRAKDVRRQTGKAVSDPDVQACFAPVAELYQEVTGRAGVDPQEVMRHRLLLLGRPCAACGRPLRTRKARKCAECGVAVTGAT